jgi:hypothetical protein
MIAISQETDLPLFISLYMRNMRMSEQFKPLYAIPAAPCQKGENQNQFEVFLRGFGVSQNNGVVKKTFQTSA